jgi:hypothetical protein
MQRLAVNGDFSQWTSRPLSGMVVVGASGSGSALPDSWYGGAGPGGQFYFYAPPLSPSWPSARSPSRQYALLNWTQAPTVGNGGDYPGTDRSTYLEQNGNESPEYAADKVWTFSFDAWCGSGSLSLVPIIWQSMGTLGWLTGQPKTVGDYVTAGGAPTLRLYQATSAGTTGAVAPSHTVGTVSDGGVDWLCVGEAKGRAYEIYEGGPAAHAGMAYIAKGVPKPGASVTLTTTPARFAVDIALPKLGTTNSADYADSRTTLAPRYQPEWGGARPYCGLGFDLVSLPAVGTVLCIHNVEVNDGGCNRFVRQPRRLNRLLSEATV